MQRKKVPHINFLRKHRILNGYSLKHVAFLLDRDTIGAISEWEQGARLPNAINLLKLCVIYRTLPSELLPDLMAVIREDIAGKEEALLDLKKLGLL